MGDSNVSRRRLLESMGTAGLVGLAGCTGGGDQTPTEGGDGGATDSPTPTPTPTPSGPSGTVKIGVLQPVSGDLQYYGQQSAWGFFSGLAYKGGTDPIEDASTGTKTTTVGDVDYELIVRDSKFNADTAQTLATDLVQEDEVDLLFGPTSSGSAQQIINTVVKPTNVPLMVGPAASAGITSSDEFCHPMVFRASENTAMDARSGGKYVARETDVSKVFLFGADYSFGHAVVDNYRTVLEAEGVEIIDEKFVPRGYDQWTGLLDQAQEQGAEGIVGGFTVATLPQLFTTFLNGDYDFRVFGGLATNITNTILGQTLQKVLGEPLTEDKIAESNLGPFTTRYHWNQYDNMINEAFVDMYSNAYGMVPDLFSSGTFTAASAIVQAVEASGSTEGADIAGALRGMTVTDTPKGEGGYTFQTYNNQARSEMTVADLIPTTEEWADLWGAAVMPSEPVARIPGDEATIPADDPGMNCSL